VPENSDFAGAALEVSTTQQSFDETLAGLIDTRFARTELREQLTVAGRPAFRLELVATGEGLEERGTRSYGYLIARAGPPILVRTTARPGEPLEHRPVVDHAAATLRPFASTPVDAPVDEAILPAPVAEKREAILAALEQGDVAAVAELAADDFRYTFGENVPGGAAAYWRENPDALEALGEILGMPYTLATGHYVWPFAYDKPANTLTDYERNLLEPLETTYAGESYLGWRAGFTPDGSWVYLVAGD
jgi:hypothetical protein